MVIFFSLLSLIIQLTVGKGVDEFGRSNPQCFCPFIMRRECHLKRTSKEDDHGGNGGVRKQARPMHSIELNLYFE